MTMNEAPLVGRWVCLGGDRDHLPHLGVLTRRAPSGRMSLRSPQGPVLGYGLAELLTRAHRREVRRARRQLRVRMAWLQDIVQGAAPGEGAELASSCLDTARADQRLLEQQLEGER